MRIFFVLGVIGRLLRLFSVAFIPPLLLALIDGDYGVSLHFSIGLVASLAVGALLAAVSPVSQAFHRSEAMAIVAGTWVVIAAFGSIPYVFAGLSYVDSLFESMSGFTTTGATILKDFSAHGRAFYLWRAMSQWFGGLGVLALFIVVLPRLGIAGRQLFFAEASGAGDAISPQIRQTATRLWVLYVTLTVIQIGLLMLADMKAYDAVVHSLTTVSAGGFSPNPESVGGYNNPAAEWIFVAFMILAGTSFTLQWKVFTSKPLSLVKDQEFLFYFGCTVAGALGVALVIAEGAPNWDQLRAGAFQAASLISSTGYASADYNWWNDAARAILIALMLVGGCAGSAAGGAKAIRHLLVAKFLGREITQVLHPYSVLPLRYGQRIIPPAIMRAVFTLVVLFLISYLVVGLAVVALGADLVTGFSASLACVGNIGPGFGGVGPMASYGDFPTATKLVLTAAMWVGRFEIVTVLALFHPHVLRSLQLRDRRRRVPGGGFTKSI